MEELYFNWYAINDPDIVVKYIGRQSIKSKNTILKYTSNTKPIKILKIK